MTAAKTKDMGTGSVSKLLLQLALPAVVAQVVNLLYNIVDAFTSATWLMWVPPR